MSRSLLGSGPITRNVLGLARTTSMTPMAHLTCAAHSRLDLAEVIVRYGRAGMHNLLALGGDPPSGTENAQGELRQKNEEMAALLPKGKIVHIVGAGHNVRRENKQQTVEVLRAFLAGI